MARFDAYHRTRAHLGIGCGLQVPPLTAEKKGLLDPFLLDVSPQH